MRHAALLSILLVLSACTPPQTQPDPRDHAPLPEMAPLFADDFESGDMTRWEPGDPAAWSIEVVSGGFAGGGGGNVLALTQASDYAPPVRSPANINLIRDLVVGDFTLEFRVRTTTETYGHRDICIFFGYQDPTHFYYCHLGQTADPNAHSIFIVNDAPRTGIAITRTDGTPWDDDWHRVRVVRRGTLISVYFDDMTMPVMTADDATFGAGRIGVGSFDDTAQFDDVRVMTPRNPSGG